MITTIAKAVNTAVQISARAIAFIFGVVLAPFCWILIQIIGLFTTLLWWVAYIPSWISGHLLMYALDLDPEECETEFKARTDLAKVKKVIREVMREKEREEKQAKEAEKTDDPS